MAQRFFTAIAPLLTVLDRAVMGRESVKPTAVGLTPGLHLNESAENVHLWELARKAAIQLEIPEQVNQLRSVFVYLLRNGLKNFEDLPCLPGMDLNFNKLKTILASAKIEHDKKMANPTEGMPASIFETEVKAQTSIDLIQAIVGDNIPENIRGNPASMREQISKALNDALKLYKQLGDDLYENGPKVAEMYQELTGDTELQLPPKNPLTALDGDTVGSHGFTDLAFNFLKGIQEGDHDKSEKEALDLYHTQEILWLTVVFFLLNLRSIHLKPEIRQVLSREVLNFIKNNLHGDKTQDKFEQIDGNEEPITYRKITVGDNKYLIYVGEKTLDVKRKAAALWKVMQGNTKGYPFALVDEGRGELMIDISPQDFIEGSQAVKDAITILEGLGEHLGCTILPSATTDYFKLKPREAVVKVKREQPNKRESVEFINVKLYLHLEMCETPSGGMVLIKDDEQRQWAIANGKLHTVRMEYRILVKETWVNSHYNLKHPSHHIFYRLTQLMEIAKLVIRPAENPALYEYMEVVEKMLTACRENIPAKTNGHHSSSPAPQTAEA
ncbi:hypothetical protein IPG41_01270 [Candidatus Peregrinibacteria bacterium]|nr:MAG: hypothetical protein IPG41_01270 [Candidatus Peregrinibacteria bacterium]